MSHSSSVHPRDPCAFRELEEKQTASSVTQMVWSPRMDLIAMATERGEISLFRMSWQRVWYFALPETAKVGDMAFRADGRLLAICYSHGYCHLYDIEDTEIVFSNNIGKPLDKVFWVESETFKPSLPTYVGNHTFQYKPISATGIPDGVLGSFHLTKGYDGLSILIVATKFGQLHLFGQGVLPLMVLDSSIDIPAEFSTAEGERRGKVLSIGMSADLSMLTATVETLVESEENIRRTSCYCLTYDTSLVLNHQEEIADLSRKIGIISSVIDQIEETVELMKESWENILLEVDTMLLNLAQRKAKTNTADKSLSTDFVRLLMFGVASPDLEHFLTIELNEKSIKKVGTTVDESYNKIQGLITKKLQKLGMLMVHQLVDVQGLVAWTEKYDALGLEQSRVAAVCDLGMVLILKAWELRQVIDSSLITIESFFRWLHIEMLDLTKEQVLPTYRQALQQNVKLVAQFICDNFTEDYGDKGKFQLEKVGQYLKDDFLTSPVKMDDNCWMTFLKDSGLQQHSTVGGYTTYLNSSLVQVMVELKKAWLSLHDESIKKFSKNCHVLSNPVYPVCSYHLTKEPSKLDHFKVSTLTSRKDFKVFTAITLNELPSEKFCLIAQRKENSGVAYSAVTCIVGKFTTDDDLYELKSADMHKVISLAFYDQQTLTVLLQPMFKPDDKKHYTTLLAQINLEDVIGSLTPIGSLCDIMNFQDKSDPCDLGPLLDHSKLRPFPNHQAVDMAVSGSRKVAAFLFHGRKRVRLFAMDAEDDDEDEDQNGRKSDPDMEEDGDDSDDKENDSST